jgi:hypothetical protein
MCAGMLGLQAVVLFLLGVTLPRVTESVSAGAGIAVGRGLGALCVVGAGLMRNRIGLVLGWTVQAVSILAGFVTSVMFALGLVFLALFGGAFFLGRTIDRERAERLTQSAAPSDA